MRHAAPVSITSQPMPRAMIAAQQARIGKALPRSGAEHDDLRLQREHGFEIRFASARPASAAASPSTSRSALIRQLRCSTASPTRTSPGAYERTSSALPVLSSVNLIAVTIARMYEGPHADRVRIARAAWRQAIAEHGARWPHLRGSAGRGAIRALPPPRDGDCAPGRSRCSMLSACTTTRSIRARRHAHRRRGRARARFLAAPAADALLARARSVDGGGACTGRAASHARNWQSWSRSIARASASRGDAAGHDVARRLAAYMSQRALDVQTSPPETPRRARLEQAMPQGRDAPALRRLMTELQMLLHEHPVNVERAASRSAGNQCGVVSWSGRDSRACSATLCRRLSATTRTCEGSID